MPKSSPSFRWESELSASFQQHGILTFQRSFKGDRFFGSITESTCSEGRADLVWARMLRAERAEALRSCASILQQPTSSRILALLKLNAVRSERFLQQQSGVSETTLRRALRELIRYGLIAESKPKRFILEQELWFSDLEICSFEFKLSNWKRALYQATRYRSFSHRVFVVLPPEQLPVTTPHLDRFRLLNIGLIVHGRDGQSQEIFRPRKQSPASRHKLLRALGMLLERQTRLSNLSND
jgi:hypothetical protein